MDTMDGITRDLFYFYDVAGNRTRLLYPDSKSAYYTYTSGGQFNQVKDHGSTVIADYNYNARGELNQINRDGSAPDQDWTYDPIGRLASTGWSNAASADNVTWSFTRNPASQIRTETQTNDNYSWDGHVDRTINYTANGLNQYTAVGNNAYAYDANGNLTDDGAKTYLYDIENRLVEMSAKVNPSGCASGSALIQAKLRYDPMGRLHEVENFVCGVTQGPTRFLYDGDALVAEYNGAGTMLARYIHGPAAGADDPLVEYIGAGVTASDRRNLYADARGSIVLSADSAGGAAQINTYDEYGVPGSTNTGRFQYTGQIWLSELGMNYYKARMYSPTLGRFMQTDPIGYEDNVNLYGYVGNDPVNGVDPSGMAQVSGRYVETGTRIASTGTVTVDADFNNDGVDDLSQDQLDDLGEDFGRAIVQNDGADLSENLDSLPPVVQGVGTTNAQAAFVSVAIQFVGLSAEGRQLLGRTDSIYVGARYRGSSRAPGRFEFSNASKTRGMMRISTQYRGSFLNGSHLARLIAHEAFHPYYGFSILSLMSTK